MGDSAVHCGARGSDPEPHAAAAAAPQAFAGLKAAGRRVRRPERTVATVDHNVPTDDRSLPVADPISARQLETLSTNARAAGIELFDLHSPGQGIVHVIGPELGLTQPGMIIVCGDSHTSTHGAFGALAFGIGTSEVEHVLATQCLVMSKPRTFEAHFAGRLAPGVTAKDLVLGFIGQIGTAGATGHVIEYTGEAIRGLTMEQRMTVCNMSIEAGARAGMVAPDESLRRRTPLPPSRARSGLVIRIDAAAGFGTGPPEVAGRLGLRWARSRAWSTLSTESAAPSGILAVKTAWSNRRYFAAASRSRSGVTSATCS